MTYTWHQQCQWLPRGKHGRFWGSVINRGQLPLTLFFYMSYKYEAMVTLALLCVNEKTLPKYVDDRLRGPEACIFFFKTSLENFNSSDSMIIASHRPERYFSLLRQ